MSQQLHVLIVDDQTLFREGVRRMLSEHAHLDIVGEARDGEEAVQLVVECRPDVVLLDVAMPGTSGILAAQRIRENSTLERVPSPRILMVSASEAYSAVEESLRSGAVGYVSKSASAQELCSAIEAVRVGGSYLSPAIASRMARAASAPGCPASPISALSVREREVLTWLAEGLTSREIGLKLGVSPKTVDSHRVRLMKKLDIHKVQSLVRFAIREGLLQA
jgi:DNA-binding NarL/FixJ family response regulator